MAIPNRDDLDRASGFLYGMFAMDIAIDETDVPSHVVNKLAYSEGVREAASGMLFEEDFQVGMGRRALI